MTTRLRIVVVLILIGGLVIGTAAGVMVARSIDADERAERPPMDELVFMVEARMMQQRIRVAGTLVQEPVTRIYAPRDGILTGRAESGMVITEDVVLAMIDERPLIAVEGAHPFWRPIMTGDRGEDVATLQSYLHRSDLLPADRIDGRVGAATATAIGRWRSQWGLDARVYPGVDTLMAFPWSQGYELRPLVEIGAPVSAGTALHEILPAARSVEVLIPESQLASLHIPQPGSLTLVATGASSVPGRLTEIDTVSSLAPNGAVVRRGRFVPDDGDALRGLPVGAALEIELIVFQIPDAVAVPVSAVITTDAGQPGVRIAGDAPEIRTVELGVIEGTFVEITDGLAVGDSIIITDS